MAIYTFRRTETIVTGYSYTVDADSLDDARERFESGYIEDFWESGDSDTIDATLNEIEQPDGSTVIIRG